MGRGWATKWDGGQVKSYPYKKGGGKCFSNPDGEAQNVLR